MNGPVNSEAIGCLESVAAVGIMGYIFLLGFQILCIYIRKICLIDTTKLLLFGI